MTSQPQENMSVSKRELFEVWRGESTTSKKSSAVIDYVFIKMNLRDNVSEELCRKTKQVLQNFSSRLSEKWAKANRCLDNFEVKNRTWLATEIALPTIVPTTTLPEGTRESLNVPGPSTRRFGRPSKEFSEVRDPSKRMKVSSLLETTPHEELMFATCLSLQKSGKRDAAKVLKELESSPKRASKIKNAFHSPQKPIIPYTPEEALALYVDGHYTKNSYTLMQSGAKVRNANIYPSYDMLKSAKKHCYPDDDCITITDLSAEVTLQALVDHTVRRLLQAQKEVLRQTTTASQDLSIIYKWGCDGSASQSTYKQQLTSQAEGSASSTKTDEYLFAVCIVPLQVHMGDVVVWQNPRPSSIRYCRPIKLIFEKESAQLTNKEVENVKRQINEILPTKLNICDKDITVNHIFTFTMIDGKTFSVISESSSQTCGICGATPKIMNDLERVVNRQPNETLYDYGLSTLHAWIRCFECILHISYRLAVKKWQIRSQAEKSAVEETKKKVIGELKSKMSLLVDIPKPGFGTTNDGNTARRFFSQPSLAASATGIKEDLIKRFSVVLRSMACGYAINVEAFREYAMDTAKMYVEMYPWYYMPASVHRILIHGADIIKSAVLPIGMLSEEALESRNKDFRNYRKSNTRKMSREKTMRDLFNALLYSSDPIISSISKATSIQSRYNHPLSTDVLQLLSEPEVAQQESNYNDATHELNINECMSD